MSFDLFEQLRDSEVPEVPRDIDERIHQRVNSSLSITHLVDFLCGALPHAVAEFANPFAELLGATLSKPPEKGPSKK